MKVPACGSCGCDPNNPWYCDYCTEEGCPCNEGARSAGDNDPEAPR